MNGTTQTTTRKRPKEQMAYHGSIPRRASAPAPTTEAPTASPHRAGHTSMIHPEDSPYLTDERTRQQQPDTYPEEEYAEPEEPPRLPSSARRYHKARLPERTPRRVPHLFYGLLVGSGLFAGAVLAIVVPPFWQRGMDQLHYGYPRTSQTDVNVGHYPSHKDPRSHFIALNNHGYIEVIEIPEGIPQQAEEIHLYFVAVPGYGSADQAPVTLSFEDVNGDGKLDLEVSCNNNTTIYYNDGHHFKGNA